MSDNVATMERSRTSEAVQPTLFEGVSVSYTEVKCKAFKVDTEDGDTVRLGNVRRIVVEGEVVAVGYVPLDKDDPSGPRVRVETVKATAVALA